VPLFQVFEVKRGRLPVAPFQSGGMPDQSWWESGTAGLPLTQGSMYLGCACGAQEEIVPKPKHFYPQMAQMDTDKARQNSRKEAQKAQKEEQSI